MVFQKPPKCPKIRPLWWDKWSVKVLMASFNCSLFVGLDGKSKESFRPAKQILPFSRISTSGLEGDRFLITWVLGSNRLTCMFGPI